MKYLFSAFLFLGASIAYAQDLSQGIKNYENNELAKAERIFKSVGESSKDYEKSQYYLGRIAFDQEDYDAAEEYFEEAIDQNDNVSDYHLWLGNTYGVVAQNANVFKQGLLAPKIKNEFERAVELNPKNEDALSGLVQYYTQAPGFMGGSYEKALKMANQLGALNPSRGYSARITVYNAQEKYDLVEKEYLKAAKTDDRWLMNLGYHYQARKQYNEAFDSFERLINHNDLGLPALYQVGRTSAFSGQRTDRGISALEQYLESDVNKDLPSHAGAKMRLAMIYEKKGDKQRAITLYKASLQEEPEMELAKEGLKRLE